MIGWFDSTARRNGCIVAVAILALTTAQASLAEVITAGRPVIAREPGRIVSIGGAVTEILYALGMERHIVAIDTTSLYPPRAPAEKPNVGYMRQLSPEGVLGLAPTLILAIEGAGPKETMAVLEAARVPLVLIPDRYSGEGILEKIRTVARAAGVSERGECLAAMVQTDLDALTVIRTRIDKPARVLFVLSFLNGRAMVAGRKTAADGIIRLAGGVNAIAEYEGYKPINDEALVAAKPDAVLVMQRGSESLTAETVFAHPAFALTPAAADKSFVSMEGLYLLGFGPRTALAARDLVHAFYPGPGREALPSERAGAVAETCRP